MADAVPQRLSKPERRRVLNLISDRQERPGTKYTEGLGSMDAYPQGVLRTVPRSYAEEEGLTREEAAEDVYEGGGAPDRARFLKEQQQLKETQEQFLPGTTGGLEVPFGAQETQRGQRVRGSPEGGPSEADIAAELDRQRQAQMQAAAMGADEEEEQDASKREGTAAQARKGWQTFSRLMDLFDAATIEDVVGGIMLILNTNMRLLSMGASKKSLRRKVFPAAQFPFEAAAIVSVDIIVLCGALMTLAMLMAPLIIMMVVVGGTGFAILNVL